MSPAAFFGTDPRAMREYYWWKSFLVFWRSLGYACERAQWSPTWK